jgi:hypothetical protein
MWEAARTSRDFGAQPDRYRCSLPGLAGFTAVRREGANAGHHMTKLAERVGFEPTYTLSDITGIPVQRLRPLGHLSESNTYELFLD